MTEDASGRLGRRLRRILLLLPYAIRHPGVGVDELSRKFGLKKRELMDDLNLVFMCGLPGYGPGDLIDVTIEEDRVFVRMADYFAAPLRLTPAEGVALYAGGQALAGLPEMSEAEALQRALAKLGRALGMEGDGPASAGVKVQIEKGAAAHLETLQRALAQNKRVEMQYLSASRDEPADRTVDPWALVAALGRWYVVGFDHLSGDERMFRTDRIKKVTVTDTDAVVPADFDREKYRGAFSGRGREANLVLEISPEVARWFEDYYPVASSEGLPDGWRRVRLVSSGDRWAASLLVRLGKGARAVGTPGAEEEAARLARSILARY